MSFLGATVSQTPNDFSRLLQSASEAIRDPQGRHERDQDPGAEVLVVSGVTLAFVWGATEWVAWRLAFQPQLGRWWFEILGWPVDDPPAFLWWWFAYDAYARDVFVEGAYIAASGGSRRSPWRSPCPYGGPVRQSAPPLMALPVGPKPGKFERPASLATMERCSGDGETTICATTARSISWCCADPIW